MSAPSFSSRDATAAWPFLHAVWRGASLYWNDWKQIRENWLMFEVNRPTKLLQFREKDWCQQVEYIQVPNGTGPGVRRSKRPLSVCFTSRKCFIETSHKSLKGRVRYKGHRLVKSLIGGGLPLYLVRLQNAMEHSWETNFVWFDKIPVSTINLLQRRF